MENFSSIDYASAMNVLNVDNRSSQSIRPVHYILLPSQTDPKGWRIFAEIEADQQIQCENVEVLTSLHTVETHSQSNSLSVAVQGHGLSASAHVHSMSVTAPMNSLSLSEQGFDLSAPATRQSFTPLEHGNKVAAGAYRQGEERLNAPAQNLTQLEPGHFVLTAAPLASLSAFAPRQNLTPLEPEHFVLTSVPGPNMSAPATGHIMTMPSFAPGHIISAPWNCMTPPAQGLNAPVQWCDIAAHGPWHSMAAPASWNSFSSPINLQVNHEPTFNANVPIQSEGSSDEQRFQMGMGFRNVNDESDMANEDEFIEIPRGTAFKNTIIYHDFRPRNPQHNLLRFLSQLAKQLKLKILNLFNRFGGLKVWTSIDVEYIKPNDESDPFSRFLSTKAQTVFNEFQIDDVVQKIIDDTIEHNSNFIQMRSGLVVNKVTCATIHISQHVPLAGSVYQTLPKSIIDKHAVVNVENKDERCFAYSVLSMIHNYDSHPERVSHYINSFQTRNLQQLNYPIELRNVPNVEDVIQMNVNIYGFSQGGMKRFPMYISKRNYPDCIDLLYWKGHYAWIKNFSALFSDVNKGEHKMFFCKRCLGHFISSVSLAHHQRNCQMSGFMSTIFTMPNPDSTLKFKNVRHQQKMAFKIFADCESIIESGNELDQNPLNRLHTPCSVGFKVVSLLPDLQFEYQFYRGENCIDWFLNSLINVEKQCLLHLFDNRRLIWDSDTTAQKQFAEATDCYLCGNVFGESENERKVRDHDHLTGIYRGAAHSKCNLQLQRTYKIPVFFHNFRGYDSHLIVHSLPNFPDRNVRVIAQSMEKYLILEWGNHMVFKDSLQFLDVSLERLASNLLKAGKENFTNLLAEFHIGENIDLMLRKGVYPYDYMDSWDRFDEVELPSIQSFYSTLKDESISESEYQHAKNVWNKFNCKNIGDYHDLYLKTDVLLLADVWESFSKTCFEQYKLDPAHYVSAPHLTWDAMLLYTGVKIGLLSDPEMFRFYNNNIRGGICFIAKRLAKANHPDLPGYDPNLPITWVPDIDANNLYGVAMEFRMPIGEYRWLSREEIALIDWQAQIDDQDTGYTVECDLDYPPELHDAHNDYPLAPEKIQINYSCLSQTQVEISRSYRINRSSTCVKLMPNLMDKRFYVCDYLNLKFYMDHGLKLIRVHRVIAFRQTRWLKPYMELNSQLRKNAKQEHEKDLYKKMNNSTYGKTCENLTKRSDIRLVTTQEQMKRLTDQPHCQSFKIFGESLAAIQMEKLFTKIDKPTQVGFKVLEASKLVMMRFYYDQLKVWYGDRVHLLFTDTDSFMLEIQTDDWEADMQKYKEFYDLSFYPLGNPKRDTTNEKVCKLNFSHRQRL